MPIVPTDPKRGYSFTNRAISSPNVSQPGDRLDAEFDRTNDALAKLKAWARVTIADDGKVKAGSVSDTALSPALIARIEAAETDADAALLASEAAETNAATAADAALAAQVEAAQSALAAQAAADLASSAGVASVAGRTGDVVLTAADVSGVATPDDLAALATDLADDFAPAVHEHSAGQITSGVFQPDRLGTGTPDATVFLRGDGAWVNPVDPDAPSTAMPGFVLLAQGIV